MTERDHLLENAFREELAKTARRRESEELVDLKFQLTKRVNARPYGLLFTLFNALRQSNAGQVVHRKVY